MLLFINNNINNNFFLRLFYKSGNNIYTKAKSGLVKIILNKSDFALV